MMLQRIALFSRLTLAGLVILATSEAAYPQAIQPQPNPARSSTPPPVAQVAPSGTPPATAPQPAAVPDSNSNTGFVDVLNKLWQKSADGLSSTFKGSQQSLEDFNTRTKDATSNLTRMQSVVIGRSACPVAGNGAPDCQTASEKLCKAKGYKEGKSLDIETAEKCSAKVYISGRTGAPGECRTENYVTRAVCQ